MTLIAMLVQDSAVSSVNEGITTTSDIIIISITGQHFHQGTQTIFTTASLVPLRDQGLVHLL